MVWRELKRRCSVFGQCQRSGGCDVCEGGGGWGDGVGSELGVVRIAGWVGWGCRGTSECRAERVGAIPGGKWGVPWPRMMFVLV